MGKVVAMMSVSVDGYIEGPNRDIDWHRVDEEVHRHFNEYLAPVRMFLDGRVTHQLMVDFWPTADAAPDCPPTMAEFARIWRDKPKLVYSRTLADAGWNTTVVRDVVPAEVAALKAEPGDLSLGGAGLIASFMALDLIDEYRVYVHPILIGRGKPLFGVTDTVVDLDLIESRQFGNGVTLLHYARV